MTELELRQQMASTFEQYLGAKKGSAQHKFLVDTYNKIYPLPVGYKMTYQDNWCAGSASAIAFLCGNLDIVPAECSCNRQIALWKQMGRWIEDESITPKVGMFCYYDWQDVASYANSDNNGDAEHVGIVNSVSGNTFTVIEGNKGDESVVGIREMKVNGRYLRGFGDPDYASKATKETVVTAPAKTSDGVRYSLQNGIHITEVPVSLFKIKMANLPKRNIDEVGYTNANFFATYHEENKKVSLTLPVGHLISDYSLNPSTNKSDFYCDKYCRERGKVSNGKFTFDSAKWSYDNKFYGKALTTLTVKNGVAEISDYTTITDKGFDYAITGIPVMKGGKDVSWLNYVKKQGWDGSELYSTYHIFVGLKTDRTKIYVMGMRTTSSNLIYSAEEFKKFSALGFVDVIKLDGGGSAQYTVDGKSKVSTIENRRINAIITFPKTSSTTAGTTTTNPYPLPSIAVTQKTTNKDAVRWLQWILVNKFGENIAIDGSFGPATLAALKRTQTKLGLVADGSCGPATKAALLK